MSKPNKLIAVIRHEYFTIVKQPTFWLIMLAIPALITTVLAISFFSGKATDDRIMEAAKKVDNIAVIDKSGLINKDTAKASGIEISNGDSEEEIIKNVKNRTLDGVIIYPEDITKTRTYTIHASTEDLTQSSTLQQFGDTLLTSSLFAPLGSEDIIALAQTGAISEVITYENGQQSAGIKEYIVPGFFVLLFYIVLVYSVNYMLTSVAEEKENRSMEMVLSYVKPRTLIFGKLLGIALITLTQLIFLLTVAITAYLIARNIPSLALPLAIDLSGLIFDPVTIFVAIVTLIAGFLLFAALMAGVGSMVPSAKDAGGLSFIFIIGAIIPFYTIGILTTDPGNPVTRFMTFFPTTAPTTILVRNTVGNLEVWEILLGITLLIIYAILAVMLAGKLFRIGALEFNNRVSLRSILGR